ncbi:MAG: SGNH/GDSL hydrolase family protein [Candidatus Omnitrophica bacterium]|nr:SGNH/GDSL hydrolase family protein [Candidatus Omnitrophota bacterium]
MKNKVLLNSFLLLSTLLLLAIVSEVLLILRWDILGGGLRRSRYPDWIAADSELMWIPKANTSFDYSQKDGDGSSYPVHYQTGLYGFRQWGNPQSPRKKILVIGDSNTHALEVSNDKTYYHLMAQKLDVEIFALGVSAYNTVQERLALKRFLPMIKPDLILWQFNANDLYSNDCRDPAGLGFIHNPVGKLLCWDIQKNQVGFYEQKHFLLWLTHLKMTTPSRFIYWLATRTLSLQIKSNYGHSTIAQARLDRGKESTLVLFREIKKEVGNIPVYLFSNDETPFYAQTLKQAAEQNGFYFISGIMPELERREKQGENFYALDHFHLNENGHAGLADFLIKHFQSRAGF